MANEKLTQREINKIVEQQVAQRLATESKDVDRGLITRGELNEEWIRNIEKLTTAIVAQTKELAESKRIQKEISDQAKRSIREQGIVPTQTSFEELLKKVATKDFWLGKDESVTGLEALARARTVGTGFEQMIGGNVLSGLQKLGSALPGIAQIMGGPLAVALSVATKGLMAFDEHITKLNKNISVGTGSGRFTELLRDPYYERLSYTNRIKDELDKYYMTGDFESILTGMGTSYHARNLRPGSTFFDQLYGSVTAARTTLGGVGLSTDIADRLLQTSIRSEGLMPEAAATRLDKLIKFAQGDESTGIFSTAELLQQQLSLYDQIKKFGTNMDWTTRIVDRFSEELEKGTMTLSNFASINVGMREGETAQLAGIGQMMVENALAQGLDVPKELLNSMGNPLAMAWNMRKLAESGDPRIQSMIGSNLSSMVGQMGITDPAAINELVYGLLPQFTFGKLSQPQVESLVSSGFTDFAGAYATAGGVTAPEQKEIQKTLNDIKNYAKQTTTFSKQIGTIVSGAFRDFYADIINPSKPIPVRFFGTNLFTAPTVLLGYGINRAVQD